MNYDNMNELQVIPQNSPFAGTAEFEHNQRIAKMLCASELIPNKFQGNIQNTLIALELANRIGMSPIMVMQNLDIIQGKPSWSSTFIIAAINNSGKFSPLRFDLKGSGMDMSCYAYAKDLETGMIVKGATVTMAMAKSEGWIDKPASKWKTMPEQMIMYRSGAFFGRVYVPEIMMGMQTVEEVTDVTAPKQIVNKEVERIQLMINDCTTLEELSLFQENNPDVDIALINARKEAING